ncbi:RNA helicase [Malassezia equina]|uniref:ATP-dependent RNA helicase n=1 Tax=Malassezia equina TaxID=1381935 RepID=A0AAF0EEA9_9BASI|nr:RNA helicase [Malassezia equina]
MGPQRRGQGGKRARGTPVHHRDVPWVSMPISSASEAVNETTDEGFEGLDMTGDDFLGLQTAEGFDVVYETDATGKNKRMRIVKVGDRRSKETPSAQAQKTKKKSQSASQTKESPAAEDEAQAREPDMPTEPVSKKKAKRTDASLDDIDVGVALQMAREQDLLLDDDAGDDGKEAAEAALPGWASLPLHPRLKLALSKLQFSKPTHVQAQAIPPSMGLDGAPRDVVGIAQTGSGKTLAYGLPILHYILENSADSMDAERPLDALILAPTRELALQVTTHLQAVTEAGGRFANVAAVCGGMSVQKQQRVLLQHGGAHVVVATPGRLWDMLKHDDAFALRVRRSRFLVIDEADRMVEAGHFAEMDAILGMVCRTKGAIVDANEEMQTFVYSATMAKALQTNLKKAHWRKKQRRSQPSNTLDDLLARVDFRDAEPLVVELVPERHVADTLWETKVECIGKDKDVYLYYILLRYPGRTLVFLNAIDGVRRLVPLLTTLGMAAFPLHGQLQQQQRLKNLDRFRKTPNCVLLATDVAARGIDIQGVDHVVHFQLPRSADTYVHRAGRTARAGHIGVSIALIEPSEMRLWHDIWQALQRADTVAALPVEYAFMNPIRERLTVAKEIDRLTHMQSKASHDDAWLRQLAKDAELDYESDASDPDADHAGRKRKRHAQPQGLARLKQQLADMLARPLSARGVSQKYITSGSRPEFVQTMLAGDSTYIFLTPDVPQMIGLRNSTIHADMAAAEKPSM